MTVKYMISRSIPHTDQTYVNLHGFILLSVDTCPSSINIHQYNERIRGRGWLSKTTFTPNRTIEYLISSVLIPTNSATFVGSKESAVTSCRLQCIS